MFFNWLSNMHMKRYINVWLINQIILFMRLNVFVLESFNDSTTCLSYEPGKEACQCQAQCMPSCYISMLAQIKKCWSVIFCSVHKMCSQESLILNFWKIDLPTAKKKRKIIKITTKKAKNKVGLKITTKMSSPF